MKYSEARTGRIFVIRLEDGDILHEQIEAFAEEHGIARASLIAVGAADKGSRLVVGPEESRVSPPKPMTLELRAARTLKGRLQANGFSSNGRESDSATALLVSRPCQVLRPPTRPGIMTIALSRPRSAIRRT